MLVCVVGNLMIVCVVGVGMHVCVSVFRNLQIYLG